MPSSSGIILAGLVLLCGSFGCQAAAIIPELSNVAQGVDCSAGDFRNGWIPHNGSCYRWNETSEYWYVAEQQCKASGGHLVSIGREVENTVVGRLTYCQEAWIGRYAVDATRLPEPDNYRWTDGSTSSSYERHNTSRLFTPHQPLISAVDLQWQNNLYHEKQSYVCKAKNTGGQGPENSSGCLEGWRRGGQYCYLQPNFKATYIEAGYFCDGKQAQLVSVHSDSELRLLSLLDLSQPVCSLELWLGLVKLNPCRMDFSTGRARQVCYRWADRSGDYRDFPAWAKGHPNNDLVTNCVVLRDRRILTVPCHLRRNFVCKRRADDGSITPSSTTPRPPTPSRPPTAPPSPTPSRPPTTVERLTTSAREESPFQVFLDFRRKQPGENLARPGRYPVTSWGDAVLDAGGALLNGSRGIELDTEAAALTAPLNQARAWTIVYYAKRAADYDQLMVDVSGPTSDPGLTLTENPKNTDLSIYSSQGYFRDESDMSRDAPSDARGGVLMALVFSNGRANFYRNGLEVSAHMPATSNHRYDDNNARLVLGNAYQSMLPGYRGWLACFGVAHVALSPAQLKAELQSLCPT